MKIDKRIFIIITFLILLVCIFTACNDSDYIEVTAIRVPTSTVYLSPDGVTSSYQLEKPAIQPANATNTKVIYYVSPEYLQYFSVDQTGLITAKKLTEDVMATIKVYSSTNESAFAMITVVIENVEVKEIRFKQTEIRVQYDSQPFHLELEFVPYHAQYGRDVTFIALNPNVITVDNSGLVTIENVGITTVIARSGSSLISDIAIEGRTQITVGYAPGLYELSVTSDSPQFDQIVGEPQPISFSISRDLYDNIDLNPDIKWYVGGTRERSNDGEWEFDFIPQENSEPTSFYIEARIQPKGEDLIVLRSPSPISLYRHFSDFSIDINQPKGTRYPYGEDIEFTPPPDDEFTTSDRYDWYIKEKGTEGLGRYLGHTKFAENLGVFTVCPPKAVAYIVTALVIKDEIAIDSKEYSFNVIKYTEYEKIQVTPKTLVEQRIPDSYDWSVHPYDEITQEIGERIFVSTTSRNSVFTYETTQAGTYILSCTPTLNNLPVSEDGPDATPVPMRRYTEPFRVWALEEETDVDYILIDGALINDEYRPVIKWNALGGTNNFIIELNVDNKVYLIDTAEKDLEEEIVYRDYSIVLPLTMATLEQDFSVRIKKSGGVYSPIVTYKAKTISDRYNYFLKELNYGINTYIQDMDELGSLLQYIATFRPKQLLVDNQKNIYTIKIATNLLYRRLDSNRYPVFAENPFDEDHLINIFNLVSAAINANFIIDIEDYEITHDPIRNGYDIKLTLLPTEYFHQREDGVNNFDFATNYSDSGKREEAFLVNTKEGIEVSTSQQLYYAVTTGKRPLPTRGGIADQILQEAKDVLIRILHEEMSDTQKVLAIYEFLASEIENDLRIDDYSRNNPEPRNLYVYDSYYLEGVFLHQKAVSAGKSKAFNLLCWLEGITAQTIHGKKDGALYSWNKVRIGENWYNIDTYSARNQREYGSAINYNRFLLSNQKMAEYGYTFYATIQPAEEDYDILSIGIKGYETINDLDEISIFAQLYADNIEDNYYSFCVKFSQDFEEQQDLRDIILEYVNDSLLAQSKEAKHILQFSDNYYTIIIGTK